jgi:hypothetical protein
MVSGARKIQKVYHKPRAARQGRLAAQMANDLRAVANGGAEESAISVKNTWV